MTATTWHWGDDLGILSATLSRGGIVALPTESSYALGVDPRNAEAVEKVSAIKGRDTRQPQPVIVASRQQIFDLGVSRPPPGLEQVAVHWPAALSILLPLDRPIAAAGSSGMLALRVPKHAGLRRLLERLGSGLTASSANRTGEPPITEPGRLAPLLAATDACIIDDGHLPGGAPSTLVRWDGEEFEILRHGRFPAARLRVDAATACG